MADNSIETSLQIDNHCINMWALCDACYKFLNYDNFQQVNSGQNATLRFGIYEKNTKISSTVTERNG